MIKFLRNAFIFLFLCAVICLLVLSRANGESDAYYERLTTPAQTSLIIGTSRSAQGILPSILNSELGRSDIYNFSFTISHSPYGPVYLDRIDQKLLKNSKNGIFILSVDPWSISSTGEDPNDESMFTEQELFLSDLNSVKSNPNIEYLLKYYDHNYFKLLYKSKSTTFLHNDGWLEVNVDIENKAGIDSNIKNKIAQYRKKNLSRYKFSEKRLEYLKNTIRKLKIYGKVYLVRLPIHKDMMEIENVLMPDFDLKIKALISVETVPFLNLTRYNSDFQYTDGNHLYKESGKEVTILIAKWIKSTNNK